MVVDPFNRGRVIKAATCHRAFRSQGTKYGKHRHRSPNKYTPHIGNKQRAKAQEQK